jgi:hypothetical protein
MARSIFIVFATVMLVVALSSSVNAANGDGYTWYVTAGYENQAACRSGDPAFLNNYIANRADFCYPGEFNPYIKIVCDGDGNTTVATQYTCFDSACTNCNSVVLPNDDCSNSGGNIWSNVYCGATPDAGVSGLYRQRSTVVSAAANCSESGLYFRYYENAKGDCEVFTNTYGNETYYSSKRSTCFVNGTIETVVRKSIHFLFKIVDLNRFNTRDRSRRCRSVTPPMIAPPTALETSTPQTVRLKSIPSSPLLFSSLPF